MRHSEPKNVLKESEFVIGKCKIRCYVCDDGKRYLNADDVENLFESQGIDALHECAEEISKNDSVLF